MDTDGLWIIACDKDENRHSIWLDKHARVDKETGMLSSFITTEYSISDEDYIKLYAFLPEEATAHIPLDNPMKNYVIVIIGAGVLVFLVAFIIGFAIKRKKVTQND